MIGAIILQFVLIFLNAVFASAEIAVISINDAKLKVLVSEGNTRAVRLHNLTEQPARFLATIQVAITLATMAGSAFAAENFSDILVDLLIQAGVPVPTKVLDVIVVCAITFILAYFNIVLGELVPKRIAMKKAEEMALGMSGILTFISKVFAPIVFLLTKSTNGLLRLIGINPEDQEEQVTEEEIRMLLAQGKEQGTIDSDETQLIQNVFEFNDISVEKVCTHRIDTVTLFMEDSPETWEETIHTARHTYYPVCGEDMDDILGVLDTKDYFRLKDRSTEQVMKYAVDEAYFIPENMKANRLFQDMRTSHRYFAVVIDEYGGTTGIVTMHDLVESLVGDLDSPEEEHRPKDIEQVDESTWRIQGFADLADVARALHLVLPEHEYETFGGYILGILGRVPGAGETFTLETDDLEIQVNSVTGRRIGDTVTKKKR